ncbi:SGNH/GDSL hydrolase family protein [Methyloglobulus sp.]|uniref:SGNH/GDSL hydrolase family protein n=1 Tax=Methyloglobulus sp. TaxID=2518622 RepID=UPI0032B739FD
MIIQPNSKLVIIGDSITDCDRARPIGEGLFDALGNGYVSLLDSLLTARYPAHHIRVVNMGISGNTIRDLQSRWQTDVVGLKPDWLTVFIGINDVWRHFHSPNQPEWHVPLDEYTQTLDELLQAVRPSLKGLILMTPYFIEPNTIEPMRKMMGRYGEAVRQLAEKHQAILVDTQAAFDAVLNDLHPMALAWDRVHPTRTGHMVLAIAFLQTIGYKW